MTIWDCPLSAALFHSQSWWCASFHHSITFICVSSSIASHVSKDDDMKVSFKYILVSPLPTGFTGAWAILEWQCPRHDLNVLVHWLSFFEHHCLQFTDSSFNHCLIADLSTACFSFSRSTVLPPVDLNMLVHQFILKKVFSLSLSDAKHNFDELWRLIIWFFLCPKLIRMLFVFLPRVHCIAPSCSTFQGVSRTSMSFQLRISETQSMFFCVQ